VATEGFVQHGFGKSGGSVVKWSIVSRLAGFSGGRQFCASKSPTSCSCKTLAV